MNLNAFNLGMPRFWLPPKMLMIMRLIIVIMTTCLLQVSASTFGQRITLSERNTPLEKVLKKIKAQSGLNVVFADDALDKAKAVNIKIANLPLKEALNKVLENQPLFYELKENTIVIIKKEKTPSFLDRVVDALTPPIDVRGVVLDEKGKPLVGATVKVKGVQQSVLTNSEGVFYLQRVDDKAILVISYVGYFDKEVDAKASLNITMEMKSSELNEVVVAYGKTTQQALTGAVTVVSGAQIENLPSRSFDKSLQGLVPGLQITGGTGQPGGGVANMVLRGIATGSDVTFGSTVRNPLIVIDGIPVSQDNFQLSTTGNVTPHTNPIAQLNPSDIETISILKDASAIALYGSKASNGVILVTTKKGKLGKTSFGFRNQTDISTRLKGKTEVLNQQEYLALLYETYKNTPKLVNGVEVPWIDADILTDLKTKFPVRANGSFYPRPDWNGELFTNNAMTISNDLSISGGNERNNFYLNVEYTKQNGAVKETGYDRKSMRFNFESKASNWLSLGTNTTLSYNIQKYSNPGEGTGGFGAANVISPLAPIRLEDGNYKIFFPFGQTSSSATNQVAAAEYNIKKNATYRGLSKFYAEVRLLKYLTFKSDVGVDFMLAEMKEKNDPRFYNGSSQTLPKITERDERRANIINTNTLRFDQNFKENHTLSLLLGQEAQIITQKQLGAEATGTAETLPYYEQLTSPSYTMSAITGTASRQTLLSVFGQANYGYKNKYFLSASIRKDGSSKFGEQAQWGTYWSAGAGWIITEEKLIKDNVSWLNYLKIRGSIGAAGNSGAVSAFTRFDALTLRKFLGDIAVAPQSLGNPNIQWEETFTWDAGLEIRLLNERIGFTGDIYNRKTNDLIYSTNLPSISGFGSVLDNIGTINNNGIELSLSGRLVQKRNFNWNMNINWSTNENKLIKANVPLAAISGGLLANEEGRNFNSFYTPIWAGVNQADGKPQWIDGSGNPTTNYNTAKKEFVGRPQPDGYGALVNTFRYKNFEFSAHLYYQYGLMIYDNSSALLSSDGLYPYINQVKQALNYWKKPGDVAANPRRLLNNTDNSLQISTRYLFKGDYIRLQQVSLGYTVPKEIVNRLRLAGIRLYLQGHNLAILTNYAGPDPDNANVGGGTGFTYPNQRSFSVGVNVNF
jgi:TonB-linked SusC/RagA family outer membrane protein